jgi:hypothetical protein
MKILVTGATGFIGAAVARQLSQQHHEVLALSRSDAAAAKLRVAGLTPVAGDFAVPANLAAPAAQVDAIVSAASIGHVEGTPDGFAKDRDAVANGSSAQHRARPPSARRAQVPRQALAGRDRQRRRTPFARTPLPMLRRPDDHHRDVRGRAPCAVATAEPDQDRHLTTVTAHSASQRRSPSLSAAPRSTTALTSPRPKRRSKHRADAKPAPAHDRTASPSFFPPTSRRLTGLRADARVAFAILKSP